MKSIGYTEDENLHKSEIAVIQLEKAIELFIHEEFICSLTIAGPAEELLGKLLAAKGMRTVIQESVDHLNVVLKTMGHEKINSDERKSIYSEWNHAKNRTKHHDEKEDEILRVNACDESYWMIKRAISNGKYLGINVTSEQEFENWIIDKCCT